MDILPSGSIFRELQIIHETGCFSSESSFEDQWQQVRPKFPRLTDKNAEDFLLFVAGVFYFCIKPWFGSMLISSKGNHSAVFNVYLICAIVALLSQKCHRTEPQCLMIVGREESKYDFRLNQPTEHDVTSVKRGKKNGCNSVFTQHRMMCSTVKCIP
uniref:Uncharacterized protein n=1 Tax=Anopheles culicifacies TaxID=139723 RepID=A0A182MIK0_9DIPT